MIDFNLFDAFHIFDIKKYGFVSPTEIQHGLDAIGIYPSKEECFLFVSRYDKTGDGLLSFNEFMDAFLPNDNYYASMVSRRPSNYVPNV